MNKDFPTEDMELTHILVISDLEKAKTFYKDILGAEIINEYGGTSCVLKFQGNWLLLVTGGEPTKDKPDVTFAPPANPKTISHSFTIRMQNCSKSYEVLKSRGAEFLTPPFDWGQEIRCFFTDPDGHLFEISQLA
jgi:catechol 2,3-dioxygenase-like lactoylglutathione lyase family enzyme